MQTTPGEGGAEDELALLLSTTAARVSSSAMDFRVIADKSLSLIVVADHTGCILYANEAFCEAMGFACAQLIGREIQDFGQLDEPTLTGLRNVLGSGKPWQGEFAVSKRDGDRMWLSASITPVMDEKGNVTHFLATGLDITERKRAEEALRESEERFRKLAETTTAAAFIFDGGRIRYANSAATDITGYSSEELLAKSFWEIAQPDITAATRERLQARAPGEPVPPRAEVRITTKGGDARWLDFNTGFVELDGRQYVLGTAFDVTARKLAEEAVRTSEEKFRTLVETIPAAVFIYQGTGIRFANRTTWEVLGYSEEDLAALSFWEIVHPDYRDLVRGRGLARQRGEEVPSSYEICYLTRSGEARWGLFAAALITYEGAPAVLGTVYDITERRQAEEAHHESEERYRMLYQDNPSMYFTLCEGLTVLAVNKYGAGQLGYEPEDLIGQPVLEVVYPGDRNSVRRQLMALLKSDGGRQDLEFRKVRKNGEILWVKETVRRTADPDGKTILLVVCEDITERRRTEETLQRLREDLERKAQSVLEKMNPYDLSFRELTVLHLVVNGRSDKEIAVTLGIRPLTVSKHVANVLKKMRAASRTEAGVRAWREGLIE